jgi:hypothetical protein
MAAGLLAGCAASWMMNAFAKAQPVHPMPRQKDSPRGGKSAGGQAGNGRRGEASKEQEGEEDATVKTAVAVSRNLFEHELSTAEKRIAGPAVHYAYGSMVGAFYGGVAELLPVTAAGFGMPFAIALWLLGDETAVPALGLGKSPTETPVDAHADALAAHLMYGVTTDVLRRVIKHVI